MNAHYYIYVGIARGGREENLPGFKCSKYGLSGCYIECCLKIEASEQLYIDFGIYFAGHEKPIAKIFALTTIS
jgi:hypothetical protein